MKEGISKTVFPFDYRDKQQRHLLMRLVDLDLVIKMNLDLIGDLDEFSLFCFLYISHHRLHDLGFTNQEKKSLLRFLLMILRNGDESQYPIYAVAQELSKKILLEKVSLREEFAEFRLYISFSNFPEDMPEMVRRMYI